jgi:hypothetical protein
VLNVQQKFNINVKNISIPELNSDISIILQEIAWMAALEEMVMGSVLTVFALVSQIQ